MRVRNYLLTYFDDNTTKFRNYIEGEPSVRYAMYQLEQCPSTQRRHIQAYVEYTKSIRVSQIRNSLPGVHAEKRAGTREEAINYCSKEDSRVDGPFEHNPDCVPRQGRRTDLEEIKAQIDNKASELEIAEANFAAFCRYYKSFRVYRNLLVVKRTWKTEVVIYWGEPGTGKSRKVYDDNDPTQIYDVPRPNGGNVWFDGYQSEQHDVILLDDFYGWIPLHFMLKLMDRYPMQVPIKGGFSHFTSKKLFITSNKKWEEWYNFAEFGDDLKKAFKRRIDHVCHFSSVGAGNVVTSVDQRLP